MTRQIAMIVVLSLPFVTTSALAARNDAPASMLQAAKADIQKGHLGAAFDKTEKAETALLNEKQAGQNVDQALNAVQKVHQDLRDKKRDAAGRDIDDALSAVGKG